MLLEGKTVFVTGGAGGIGSAVVLKCLSEGAFVHYCDLEADSCPSSLSNGRLFFHKADVTSEAQVKSVIKEIISAGKLDVVVNNAGIIHDGLVFGMSLENWESVIKVNLTGAFLVAREAASVMAFKQKSGSIINIASVMGQQGNAGQANYSASKAGLIGFTKSLAKELAPRNVRVNAVAPGIIKTNMTNCLADETVESYINSVPLGRIGLPEDVANAVLYLASGLSSYVTGQVLRVDGGFLM